MTRYKYNNPSQLFWYIVIFIFTIIYFPIKADLTSLAKNDVFPLFTTLNIDDSFLLTKNQLLYKNFDWSTKKKNNVLISISPFGQNANRGKTIKGQPCSGPDPEAIAPILTTCPGVDTALGDLTGRSGMIALLYGKLPIGHETLPGGPATPSSGFLSQAFNEFFPGQEQGTITTEANIDPLQLFGFFSFPLDYRKRGVRFELVGLFLEDFGIRIQAGVSSIRQVVEARINTTSASPFHPANPNMTVENVNEFLMDQVDNIATEMGLDIGDVIQTSAEEIRFNLFWGHAFELNKDVSKWAHFLLIPYFEASGGFSPGKKQSSNILFAAPFGNNGHPSVGLTAGVNFDFIETIEVGGEIGFTHFFKRDFCNYRVPNSQFQTTLFPFTTAVSIQPGNNWYFSARIAAYHFMGHLSMHFEWIVVDHKQDKIKLKNPDDAFLPEVLEKTTSFKAKLGNIGFNYDISPNIGLGFLWQIPFSQRNSYRSSTIMAGLNVTF